jgi:hypothetical protein
LASGGEVAHFDTGGQQPFGYDSTAYTTNATNWANDWYGKMNQTFGLGLDAYNRNRAIADAVSRASMDNAGLFDEAAKQGLSRYQTMYAPAMGQFLQQAQDWASPANLAKARGEAISGVGQAFDAEAQNESDRLRMQGLDPRAIASRLDTGIRTQRAAAEAGAGNYSDNTRLMQQMGLLGQAIGQGQQDAGITQGFAGVAGNEMNRAINAPLATEASRVASMGGPQAWGQLAGAELKEWPKAELDAMHASNEQGALWNDINRTNLAAQQMAYNQGSGFGALAGAGLGAISNMVKFAPITISHGGVVPGHAGGGRVALTSDWRKYSGGVNPVGAADPIYEGTDTGQEPQDFTSGLKATQGGRSKGDPMFQFKISSGDEVKPTGPVGSGPGGTYSTADVQPGGVLWDPSMGGGDGSGYTYSTGGQIGGTIGSLAGSIFGPIGSMAGHFLGEFVGGIAGGEDPGKAAEETAGSALGGSGLGKLFGGGGGMASAADMGGMPDIGDSGFTFAHGGMPRAMAIQTGSIVPQSAAVPGIRGPDAVPAMVQPGEGILPLRTMQHIGKAGLQKIIDKADKEMGRGPQPPAQGANKPVPQQAVQTGPTFASYGAMR